MTLRAVENVLAVAVLAAMTLLPLVEMGGRTIAGRGVAGSIVLVQHLTLWIALLGAALAARSDRLLALSTPLFLSDRWRSPARVATSALAAGIGACLALASLQMVRNESGTGDTVAWDIPVWWALTILPIGFGAVTARIVARASDRPAGRLVAALGLAIPIALSAVAEAARADLVLPGAIALVAATALGMPIFAAIGGAALLLFWADGVPLTAVPGETYRLTVSPMLPAIPLFALSGFLLAEAGASARLARLFTALVGWLPGGLAVATTGVLAFFTPLTGASGITILSMGGLLHPVLLRAGYSQPTALGLVTVSGSIGLLFFPSLPVFLYGFYAAQPFEELFIGGLLPGALLVLVVAGYAGARGWTAGAVRTPFSAREAMAAVWEAKWELALPVAVLGSLVSGTATLVESAAICVLYALAVEWLVHRELTLTRDVPRVAAECATLLGGFLIILCVALGFTQYLIIAEVPSLALDWVEARITSPLVFLLVLNVFLIVVGALMDIYSAIVVVVPLITPIAAAYGIDPIHLGIVFLANMELGYLMPPMGENLFLSSYRFGRSLPEVYRSTLPYTVMLVIAVLLITYLPGLTLWLVRLYTTAGP